MKHSFTRRLCSIAMLCCISPVLFSQSILNVVGTGQTTGHIANINVQNNSKEPLQIKSQVFYIPSGGTYQPYIGHIPPGITVPANSVTTIPVEGFCTDVTKPAVPSGTAMPPLKEWIPVDHPNWLGNPVPGMGKPVEGQPFVVVDVTPLKPFTPGSIPGITSNPGFKPIPTTPGDNIITWPGTDNPVGGTFSPNPKPDAIAPVLIEALDRIAHAYDIERETNNNMTPLASDPEREREAVIQQTFWIYSSILSGKKYEKKDFEGRVYDQFSNTTGISVSSLPKEQKEEIDAGIADFWNTFQAVGVEAKVIRADNSMHVPSDAPVQESPASPPPASSGTSETPANCDCDSLTFQTAIDFGGLNSNTSDHAITTFTSSTNSPYKATIEIAEEDFAKKTTVKVNNIKLKCTNCRETPCKPYAPPGDAKESKMTTESEGKVLISGIEITGGKETKEDRQTSGTSAAFAVTPDKNAGNFYITFKISGTCMAADCKPKKCIRYVQINVKSKKAEKK